MRLVDYLDKGGSLGGDAPCITLGDDTRTYTEVQAFTHRVAHALARDGVKPGAHIAILSDNDPDAFACVFAISRAGGVWCPVNPRNEAAENAALLDGFDCTILFFQGAFAPLVERIRQDVPKLALLVCLDMPLSFAPSLARWLDGITDDPFSQPAGEALALIAGTGGTTGKPKGVMLPDRSIETMVALALMGYPFDGRPVYLAMAPLTHAAGVMAFPIMALGGQIVIMARPDPARFLALIERHRVTHSFLPPTVIYMLLDLPALETTDLSSLQCLWYGAAPMSAARLEEALTRIGPVMGQIFGQTEAPMLIAMMPPADHFHTDGTIAHERLASAGRPAPLVRVAIMGPDSALLPTGERGEIVVKSSLVMTGYYRDSRATQEATRDGWHRTGDIGYLDADNYLYIVDRAKDMIISGGFNVYSAEVEQALLRQPEVKDCAVFGMPDEKWGERVCAVVELRAGKVADADALIAAVKADIGSVKAPKAIRIWSVLPRSKVGKILKSEIKLQWDVSNQRRP